MNVVTATLGLFLFLSLSLLMSSRLDQLPEADVTEALERLRKYPDLEEILKDTRGRFEKGPSGPRNDL